ncbi:MAG TPA: GTP 3',8-cyclase MoaA [Mycobacteriales bacterium]|nr:GTP 3',8-cyclase MoaA [Mycobacteriales bacterium]HVX71118.1 GTP 3',8-cyclase MoaA [Mycobacteriales bacterium]
MTSLQLADRYGRVATDLRVSLTDRCNLRCGYCMPVEGLPWLPKATLLTDDEVRRLITVAVTRLGVREVRFTGGEPLLRPGLDDIIAATSALGVGVSLTTNGVGLADRAVRLREAGLQRVNVSLDTLRRDRFAAIAHRDRLDDVLAGLAAARDAGLQPIKVNAVLLRGINDDEPIDLLSYCLANGYQLRFIEQMPLDPMHSWDRTQMVTADEILDRLGSRWDLTPQPRTDGAPAETWVIEGGPDRVGVIAAVTKPFCASCNRTRLTADGQVRNCLFATEESDLRTAMRSGASDEDLARRWQQAMWGKAAGHGVDHVDFKQPERAMSAIGG